MDIHNEKNRIVVVLVLTAWGEVVLLKEPSTINGNPGGWSIIEGNVPGGVTFEESALHELSQQLMLNPTPSSLAPLINVCANKEEHRANNEGATNSQPGTVYTYTLSWEEYQAVQDKLGAESKLCFVNVRELLEETGTAPAQFASATLKFLRDPDMQHAIVLAWTNLINGNRTRIVTKILNITGRDCAHRLDDTIIMDAILPQPEEPAAEFDVKNVFLDGKNTCPGAYRIGKMMEIAGHLKTWNEKLSYAYHHYVEEELDVLRRSVNDPAIRGLVDSLDVEDACCFVREILHLPLEDGTLLRSGLGNLEEISASRAALRLYLRSRTPLLAELTDYLPRIINQNSNRLVRDVWHQKGRPFESPDDETIRRLFRLNILLNTVDFQSPDFHVHGDPQDNEKSRALIEKQFDDAYSESFSNSLGGDSFIDEFLERRLTATTDEPVRLVYFTDNNGQLVISLKCIEVLLRRQPNLTITLVPKNGQYSNDASWKDIEDLLGLDAKCSEPIFEKLQSFIQSKRLVIINDGPKTLGLHPGCISKTLCFHLRNADVVIAEGQAYAEIRGWVPPTYLLFRVTGRVAESIHGVERGEEALAFLRVGNGAVHFSQPEKLPDRVIGSTKKTESSFHAFGQTTADFVKVVRSENYRILKEHIFNGREDILFKKLREEGHSVNKNIVQIILGSQVPGIEEVQRYRKTYPPDIFAIGGGGGFNQVTLKALQMLGLRVAAGVPATDDGGSTGKIQQMIAGVYGYMFGVGDAAAILEQQVSGEAKRPILSFRPPDETSTLTDALIEQIKKEIIQPTIQLNYITDCPDFLSFVCEQLNFARVIDTHFLGENGVPGFTIKGQSIRNLNILAAFFQCGAIVRVDGTSASNSIKKAYGENAQRAWFLIESALGFEPRVGNSISTLPVTYDRAVLWATYNKPIPESEIKRLRIPDKNLSEDKKTVFGQQYMDQIVPDGKIVDFGILNSVDTPDGPLPQPDNAYLESLRAAKLFLMGAGSLFGSQLAQLAVPGVMTELILKKNIRKVLVVNHVCMNETNLYSLTDHIKAIERLAGKIVDKTVIKSIGRPIRIGDLFSDIIVPCTVAREIDTAIKEELNSVKQHSNNIPGTYGEYSSHEPVFVTLDGSPASPAEGIYLNRYVEYVLKHPEFRVEQQITDWELRVLSFLEQPHSLYKSRSETGRYRGAVYALESDINYLVNGGIPLRHIYEVESTAMNMKILKAEGKPQLEEFPGLIPESLVGVFKILLAKGAPSYV